jgi:chromate transporter
VEWIINKEPSHDLSMPGKENTSDSVREPLSRLFLRFLRFGCLAWGGPVAQIAMIRRELVEEERWISSERFNRVLAVYQVLPGPEATEMCVYFGMMAHGRVGAVLAGLGFMLPGFLLMLTLSWIYVAYGIESPFFAALFLGFQPAVAALVVRAIHRIGSHALSNRWLWLTAIMSGVLQWVGVHFLITLGLAGLGYTLLKQKGGDSISSTHMHLLIPVGILASSIAFGAPILSLFAYGLRSGLLTFGGAYTVIPFLQHDAVVTGGWMTNEQFLDGLALSSILPAPLIIFATFVGYLGGGLWGALSLTAGIFLPSFAFTLLGHGLFERLIDNRNIHDFLDGVTSGVVGLIAATTIGLVQTAVSDGGTLIIFGLSLVVAFRWKSKLTVPILMVLAGLAGLLSNLLV